MTYDEETRKELMEEEIKEDVLKSERLKTLKDIDLNNFDYEEVSEVVSEEIKERIRGEAAKWIDEATYVGIQSINLSICPKCGGRLSYDSPFYICARCGRYWETWQLFFIEFFNVTKEDLI